MWLCAEMAALWSREHAGGRAVILALRLSCCLVFAAPSTSGAVFALVKNSY